jgi:hypothetical protein
MRLTTQVIHPRGMSPRDWCDRMVLELDRFGTIPVIMADEEWKQWGREVIQLSEISIFDPPAPDFYEDFEEWAIDFNDAVFAGD